MTRPRRQTSPMTPSVARSSLAGPLRGVARCVSSGIIRLACAVGPFRFALQQQRGIVSRRGSAAVQLAETSPSRTSSRSRSLPIGSWSGTSSPDNETHVPARETIVTRALGTDSHVRLFLSDRPIDRAEVAPENGHCVHTTVPRARPVVIPAPTHPDRRKPHMTTPLRMLNSRSRRSSMR
jgi:hypothetical protein